MVVDSVINLFVINSNDLVLFKTKKPEKQIQYLNSNWNNNISINDIIIISKRFLAIFCSD